MIAPVYTCARITRNVEEAVAEAMAEQAAIDMRAWRDRTARDGHQTWLQEPAAKPKRLPSDEMRARNLQIANMAREITTAEIAARFEISRTQVERILRELRSDGHDIQVRQPGRPQDERAARRRQVIAELVRQKWSTERIAVELGIARKTAQNIIGKLRREGELPSTAPSCGGLEKKGAAPQRDPNG